MEKVARFDVNGGIKLPVGYRFCPNDEELVNYYLKRKVLAQPLPFSIIPEFDVFQTEPWGLPEPEVFKDARFYFSHRKGHVNGNIIHKRAAGSGYWKSVGKDKEIVSSCSNRVIGMRKALIFCEGKRSNETDTLWVMHEVSFLIPAAASYALQRRIGEWAVYRIFQKKRKLKTKGSNGKPSDSGEVQKLEDVLPSVIDFTVEDGSVSTPPPPCSPCSSEDY